jgi:hypothetical protein
MHLKKKGTRGAARDGRIVSEFDRVPKLKVKDWVNPGSSPR